VVGKNEIASLRGKNRSTCVLLNMAQASWIGWSKLNEMVYVVGIENGWLASPLVALI
jgi:hypothetical protein